MKKRQAPLQRTEPGVDGACAAPSSSDAKAAKLEEAQKHIEDEDTVGTEVGTDAPTLISRCQ